MALKRAVWGLTREPRGASPSSSLGARVLGHGLRTFGHGVLGQLPGKEQAHCRLDLPRRDGRALVVMRQTRRLGRDALEDVIDERIHDAHRFGGNPRVRVNLFEHLVDVDAVAFLSAVAPFPAGLSCRLGSGFL